MLVRTVRCALPPRGTLLRCAALETIPPSSTLHPSTLHPSLLHPSLLHPSLHPSTNPSTHHARPAIPRHCTLLTRLLLLLPVGSRHPPRPPHALHPALPHALHPALRRRGGTAGISLHGRVVRLHRRLLPLPNHLKGRERSSARCSTSPGPAINPGTNPAVTSSVPIHLHANARLLGLPLHLLHLLLLLHFGQLLLLLHLHLLHWRRRPLLLLLLLLIERES